VKILQFPLTKITIGFILGIILFRFITPYPSFVFLGLTIGIVCLIFLHLKCQNLRIFKELFGIVTILLSVLIGISTATINKESLIKNHYINQNHDFEREHNLKIILVEKLKNSTKNFRYIARIKNIDSEKSSGKIIFNLPKNDKENFFSIGAILEIKGKLYINKPTYNPNQFDYGKYLENQEIYAQVYGNSIQTKGIGNEGSVVSFFFNFRDKIIANLKLSSISAEELNVLVALILGQQQDISADILKDYQYAGAVHILSVSGLHVGIIMLFITFLLKPIPNSKKGQILKLTVIIASLFTFAILAGLSPSVVRSVTMFSFVAIGIHLRRTVNIYHTLMVSMLLILLFKPSFIYDVGFQLSYLALFFIIWLQPILSNIWQPNNKIVAYFWEILTVSFAAQIGAMPLSIYYFHQFPGLFFFTNLLVLPLLGIIMAVGVIAIVIAIFSTVPYYIAKALEFLISFFNKIIHSIASFEDFVIRNISFSMEMLCCSYFVIFFCILWIKQPNFKKLGATLLSIIVLQTVYIFQKYATQGKEEFIVFNIKGNTIFTIRKGQNVTVYSNDSILANLENNQNVQSYLVGNFCQVKQKKLINNFLYFKGNKILVIDSLGLIPLNLKPDILILTQSPKINLDRVLNTLNPEEVVFDGSNYKSYLKHWEATCKKQKIPFHNTNEKGFYNY
jgi:competence protein ComEC